MKARVSGEPSAYRRGFVRAVIVHDQMDVQFGGSLVFQGSQKLQKLRASVAPMKLADDCAGGNVQRGKQRRRAMAKVIMGASFRQSGCQGKHRLGAIKSLYLALLIHA